MGLWAGASLEGRLRHRCRLPQEHPPIDPRLAAPPSLAYRRPPLPQLRPRHRRRPGGGREHASEQPRPPAPAQPVPPPHGAHGSYRPAPPQAWLHALSCACPCRRTKGTTKQRSLKRILSCRRRQVLAALLRGQLWGGAAAAGAKLKKMGKIWGKKKKKKTHDEKNRGGGWFTTSYACCQA